eukprot:5563822-Lingulodinium_polyedra.AAC.1
MMRSNRPRANAAARAELTRPHRCATYAKRCAKMRSNPPRAVAAACNSHAPANCLRAAYALLACCLRIAW